jgi:hypothetical protein
MRAALYPAYARFRSLSSRKGTRLALVAMVAMAVLGNCLSAGLWTRHFSINGPYLQETGMAWFVPKGKIVPPVPWLSAIESDSLNNPEGAAYEVTDEAGPLGRAHSEHAEIRESGAGRYSFWNNRLLFSTRHGEDPNAIHLELFMSGQVVLTAPVRFLLNLIGSVAAILLFAESRRILQTMPFIVSSWTRFRKSRFGRLVPPISIVTIGLFIVIFDAVILFKMPYALFYGEDTEGYYLFSSVRTAGYGLLLHGVEYLFGDPYAMVPLQFLMAMLATLVLCAAVRQVFRSSLLAISLGVVLTLKQGLIETHFTLLPDSLFFSCVTAELGLALLLLRRASPRRLCMAGAVISAAMLLRPAAIGLLPGLGIVVALIGLKQPRRAGILVALLAASVFANALMQPVVTLMTGQANAGAGKFSGYVLMGSAGFLLTPDTPTTQPELRDRLVTALAPIRAAWVAADTTAKRIDILLRYQDLVIYQYAVPIACQITPKSCNQFHNDMVLRDLALDAIRHDPRGMLQEIIAKLNMDRTETLAGSWHILQEHSFTVARDSMERRATGRAWLSKHPYDLTPHADEIAPDPFGSGVALDRNGFMVNALILALAITSVGWFLLAATTGRLGNELAALGVAATGFLAYHVFVCLLQVPNPRYSEPLSAWFLLTLGGAALLALRGLAQWFFPSPTSPVAAGRGQCSC